VASVCAMAAAIVEWTNSDRVAAVLDVRLFAHVAPDGLLLVRALLDGVAPLGVTGRHPFGRVAGGHRVVLPKTLELLERETVTLFDAKVDEGGGRKVALRRARKAGHDDQLRPSEI
jgi:hypothetical protein